MSEKIFKLGILKLGCIGLTPMLDFILDERADRKDITVRAYTSGSKLDVDSCQGPVEDIISFEPDLVLLVNPNATLPGPTLCRETLFKAGITVVSIGDTPSKKAFYKKNAEGKQSKHTLDGQGFIIIPFDPMIGARKEILDPTEMTLFNSDVIRLLSATGVIRFIQRTVDDIIQAIKKSGSCELPAITMTPEDAVNAAGFSNSYAAAKAYAALIMGQTVASITTKACFIEKEPEKYTLMAMAGHELMRAAASLADQAREIEKVNNSIYRTPHNKEGDVESKIKLIEK
ncbi:MAG: F420-dependent methylenetetrahydromethanopterin dehydrogenase [Proteobacteria bacterium]|nr:F420-dependent methylenetetrahydromethanopterin dehydrogenase [Pseudomonadota bacterium]